MSVTKLFEREELRVNIYSNGSVELVWQEIATVAW
jgi:hypothetical protein